jgi:serine/threonine protein kinase
MNLAPRTRLGPYEIVGALGAGGMGEVYRALDTRLGRPVAVKVLGAGLAADPGARARFQREARAIAAVSHSNICALYDVGEEGGVDFLVMELLEGETLQQRLGRGALEVDQLVEFAMALADALDVAHGLGLIHRDLKPANIFVTTRGVPKILDFGLAKEMHSPAHDVTRPADAALTVTGTGMGTLAYMSPEQLRGEPLDARTDLFSFGLVLYEMATGRRAFSGATGAMVAAAILREDPPAPRSVRPDLPERLEETILKTLEKDRALRCQTAAELRADLMRIKRQSGAQALPAAVQKPAAPGTPESGASTPAPARARYVWVAAAAAIVAAALFAFWSGPPRSRDAGSPGPSMARGGPPPDAQPPDAGPPSPPGTPPEGRPPRLPAPPSQEARPPGGGLPGQAPPPSSPESGAAPTAAGEGPPGADADSGRRGRGRAGRRTIGANGGALVAALRNAPPETFDLVFASNDPAARDLAFQLRGVLSKAGWTCESTLEIAEPQARFGVFAPQVTKGLTLFTNWAVRSGFDPDIRLVRTLPRPRLVIGRQLPE